MNWHQEFYSQNGKGSACRIAVLSVVQLPLRNICCSQKYTRYTSTIGAVGEGGLKPKYPTHYRPKVLTASHNFAQALAASWGKTNERPQAKFDHLRPFGYLMAIVRPFLNLLADQKL